MSFAGGAVSADAVDQQGRDPRIERQTECALYVHGMRHRGHVINFSESGLFIQTGVTLSSGEWVQVRMQDSFKGEAMTLNAHVIRRQDSSSGPGAGGRTGLGLRIVNAGRQYLSFVKGHLSGVAIAASSGRTFRVRMVLPGTQRSRLITIGGASVSDARVRALSRLDVGWEIAEVF